jgi:hypothetical protein
MIAMTKTVVQVTLLALAAFVVVLFRRSIKRIYQATLKPVVMKGINALRVGL